VVANAKGLCTKVAAVLLCMFASTCHPNMAPSPRKTQWPPAREREVDEGYKFPLKLSAYTYTEGFAPTVCSNADPLDFDEALALSNDPADRGRQERTLVITLLSSSIVDELCKDIFDDAEFLTFFESIAPIDEATTRSTFGLAADVHPNTRKRQFARVLGIANTCSLAIAHLSESTAARSQTMFTIRRGQRYTCTGPASRPRASIQTMSMNCRFAEK